MAQLAQVAGPALLLEHGQQGRIEFDRAIGIAFLGRQLLDQGAAVGAFAQRRQGDRHALQAVIQVAAKSPHADPVVQVAMRGADQVNVEPDRRLAAERRDFALFEHP